MALANGQRLGPYEIIAPLGAGGMGEVYRARDTRLDREVAIKVLSERIARDEQALNRFRRETKALAALSHSNILMILDVGEHENVSYAVMELLEGHTLRERLGGLGLDWRKALEIAAALADGLAAAHARGIVHRDLKPENVFLTKEGVVKILDFGLARTGLPESADTTGATQTIATQPGIVLGTVNYMSPEQVRGQPTDPRGDIFSLGCVLYEMLTGKPPFMRETSAETMTAILRHYPVSPSGSGAHVPRDIDPVVSKCLEKTPGERFHSAHDLAFTLRSVLVHSGKYRNALLGSRRSWTALSAIGLIAISVGVFYVGRGRQGPTVDPIDSIAVLPFVNGSGDPEQEYFADGMTEALIADLAKIRALKVISRTSAMQFKGVRKPLPEIARQLNVEAVVEGSVLRAGDRVRITAQLIDAPSDKHLWAESYEGDLRDILQLQSEVARTIAQEIKIALTPQEQARIAAARPVNPEAYQAYLKGRFYWNKRTADGVRQAVEHFEQAVSLAPDWPLAHLGLADAYVLMPQYGSRPATDAMPKARAAAVRALELNDSLGEAHATLGLIAEDFDWDWPTAKREFEHALALSPNYATAHHWYALYLMHTGRYDEAVKEMTKAQELDPLSLIIGSVLGMAHWTAGNLDQAEVTLRRTLELSPDFATAHWNLAFTLWLQGKHTEAIEEVREAVRLSNNAPKHAAFLSYMCAKTGQPEEARKILDDLITRSTESYTAPIHFARLYAGLGETDKVFDWLEKAYQERDAWLLNFLIEPLQADLRSDPRFIDLVRRVGLPPLAPIPSTAQSVP